MAAYRGTPDDGLDFWRGLTFGLALLAAVAGAIIGLIVLASLLGPIVNLP